MGIDINSIDNLRTRQRIREALGAGGDAHASVTAITARKGDAVPGPARPLPSIPGPHSLQSTDESKLNKTEWLFLLWMRQQPAVAWIGVQNITLKLADDCRYTPDFAWVNLIGKFEFIEVKGFWRDDARVKIKVAARMFPWAKFKAVKRVKNEWNFEEINP